MARKSTAYLISTKDQVDKDWTWIAPRTLKKETLILTAQEQDIGINAIKSRIENSSNQ